MRLAIAGLAHETVTFLPDETSLQDFGHKALRGAQLLSVLHGSRSVAGGFIDLAETETIQLTGLVHSDPAPSGPVADEAFVHFLAEIIKGLETLAKNLDGLLIHLHGAMATPTRLDPEGDILAAIRKAMGADFPIAVGMDLHGNLSPQMFEHATIVCGYHHSPHIDMRETGVRAAQLLTRTLRGEIRPTTAIRKVPVVLPSIFTATVLSPLAEIMAEARRLEQQESVLDISIFTGFAYADVPDIGFSVVVITDDDLALADELAKALSTLILAERDNLYKRDLVLPYTEAVTRALALGQAAAKPVVILEHADRMNDSTYVLGELVERGAVRAVVPYLWDPDAVSKAVAAGQGARLKVSVGGHSSARAGRPVMLDATVRFAGPKQFIGTGPMHKGVPVDLGDAAVLEADGLTIILTSVQQSAIDLDPFLQFGLNVEDFDIIVLRSKTHFRAVYEPMSEAILIADTPDWGPADLSVLNYRHARPGVFPIST